MDRRSRAADSTRRLTLSRIGDRHLRQRHLGGGRNSAPDRSRSPSSNTSTAPRGRSASRDFLVPLCTACLRMTRMTSGQSETSTSSQLPPSTTTAIRWNVVPSPSPGAGQNTFFGVAPVTPQDAWAVGFYVAAQNQDRPRISLIEHWDGKSWQVVSSPNPGGTTYNKILRGITAISANDVWPTVSRSTSIRSYPRLS